MTLNNPGTSTLIPPPPIEPDQFYTDYAQFLEPEALSGSRLGVVRNYFGEENGVDPEVTQLAEAALETMQELGATTVDLTFTDEFLTDVNITYPFAANAEQEPFLEAYLATLSPEYPQTVEEVIDILNSDAIANSETPSIITGVLEETVAAPDLAASADYLEAAELVPMVRETLLETFNTQDLDALVFPTVDTFARPLLGTEDPAFVNPEGDPPTRPVELSSSTGLPDITVPAGFSSEGLPMTISFTGRPYSEPTLFGLAYAFEQETQFRQPPPTTPPLPGEVIEYELETVPEPGAIPALTLFGLTIGFKLRRRRI